MDEERFQSLGDAMISSYGSERSRSRLRLRWPSALRIGNPLRFVVPVAVIAGVIAGVVLLTKPRPQQSPPLAPPPNLAVVTMPTPIRANRPSPKPTLAPTPSPAPTATPSPVTTVAPTEAPTAAPSPTATDAAVAKSDAPPRIHNAPLLVRNTDRFEVGKAGSCGGQDVTVRVRGLPRGCTVFDAVSSGPLKNGRGTVLIVPVSTTEDVGDVAYGLLYVQSAAGDPPRFLAVLRGYGASGLTLRVQSGLIVQASDAQTRYFTFDGRRLVELNQP